MAVKEKVKSHPDVVDYFKELRFYNKYIEKPKIKRLKTINLLFFFWRIEWNKNKSCIQRIWNKLKDELLDKKDPIKQFQANKSSIKNLFSDLLNKTNGFKDQITLKIMLKKCNPNGEIEFTLVYFNSTTKVVINHKSSLGKSFKEILYRIDNWINEGSALVVELNTSNISTYRPLSWIFYGKVNAELKSSKRGLINMKNNDQTHFLWCHIRDINPVKIHPQRITQKYKKLAKDLDYGWVKFPVQEEDFSKIETKINICINVCCYIKK